MASVVNINTSDFDKSIEEIKNLLGNTDLWMRPIAVELAGEMHDRIHKRGIASDGKPIGSYSSSYLEYRRKNKLGADPKIIMVQTRKLSNSWTAIKTATGWGVGFIDEAAKNGVTSLKKLQFMEERIDTKITDLTKEENEFVNDRANEILTQLLDKYAKRA